MVSINVGPEIRRWLLIDD